VRRLIDRALAGLARLLVFGFFRKVEVAGRDRIPEDRPVLVVANHFNGFVDPIVLARAFGRVPRFLAKATLWKIWPIRPLLALAGIIPVHRAQDGTTTANDQTFAACHAVLGRHETVAIFPEGTTHDDPYLHRMHTGAARIALGARASGVEGITILPVGLVFADKFALRSRVAVRIGRPIDLDIQLDALAARDADLLDHETVEALTDLIRDRLAAVSGDYAEWREASWCRRAAEITLRTAQPRPEQPVPLASREVLAQELADADQDERDRVYDLLGHYALDLDQLGLDDDQVVPARDLRRLAWELSWTLAALVVLGPLVVTGVTVNGLPYLAVRMTSSSVKTPVTKGTVRFMVALVTFPLAWIIFARVNQLDSWFLWEIAVAAGCGAATVFLFERWLVLYRSWRSFDVQRNSHRLVTQILPDREALVDSVYDVVGPEVVAGAVRS
jgi:1-acyl-sn-glycerol-3-phosphate acyltransferase